MPFYEYRQNNSGGSFDVDANAGISVHVIIEAATAWDANRKAEEVGLHFDGYGDCSCCGDRWYRQDEYDADDEPSIYGTPIEEHYSKPSNFGLYWTDQETEKDAYVHYLDGRVVGYQYK